MAGLSNWGLLRGRRALAVVDLMAGLGGFPRRLVCQPWRDFWPGFERCLDGGYGALVRLLVGLGVGWWVYVPVHELLHALACLASGGEVSRLEIANVYGGAFWALWAPWITAGSEYAGRLAGFDTGGCDLVYLVTVFGPYVLTLFPGVFWLRWAGARGQALAFGASLPLALAPFISLVGDAYEIASILVTRLPPWTAAAEVLRGDDVFLLAGSLTGQPGVIWAGYVLGVLGGVVWAFCTYAVGALIAAWVEGRLSRPGKGEGGHGAEVV